MVVGILIVDFEVDIMLGSFELMFLDNSLGVFVYLWSFGDGNESMVFNLEYIYIEDGVYIV